MVPVSFIFLAFSKGTKNFLRAGLFHVGLFHFLLGLLFLLLFSLFVKWILEYQITPPMATIIPIRFSGVSGELKSVNPTMKTIMVLTWPSTWKLKQLIDGEQDKMEVEADQRNKT